MAVQFRSHISLFCSFSLLTEREPMDMDAVHTHFMQLFNSSPPRTETPTHNAMRDFSRDPIVLGNRRTRPLMYVCTYVRTYLLVPTLLRSSCSYLRTRRHIRDGEEYFLLITRLERPLSLSLYYDLGVEYIPLFYFFNIRRSLYLGVSKISSSRREL